RSFCSQRLLRSPRYQEVWDHLCAGNAYSGVVERLRSDGSSCWLEATYSPVLDDTGQVAHILKIASNITERRAREERQKEHLHRLSLVADATDTAVDILCMSTLALRACLAGSLRRWLEK
ncbi:MAG: PAS domain-containing protein, partial [Comamonas sp.]